MISLWGGNARFAPTALERLLRSPPKACSPTSVAALDEYLSHVRGFGDSIRDYVSDHPEATALVQLLEDPLPADALSVVADPALRGHLGSALENAKATRIDIDHVLADLKPRLLGLYRNGVTDFRAKLVAEVEHLILTEADDGQPWKVE